MLELTSASWPMRHCVPAHPCACACGLQGYGSFPEHVQSSQVFQSVYQVAKRFYLLFQQHTNEQRCRNDGLFGTNGYSQVLQMGPKIALALPDQRGERTRKMVSCWHMAGRGTCWHMLAHCCCIAACTAARLRVQPCSVQPCSATAACR
jgi:hypothetical protein